MRGFPGAPGVSFSSSADSPNGSDGSLGRPTVSHRFPSVFFLLGLIGASAPVLANDLCDLSDEFDDPSTLAAWNRIHEHEEWFADQLEVLDIDSVEPGRMTIMPYTVSWYQDWRGPLVFKEVTGDAAITTSLTVTGRDGVSVPGSDYSLGGLLVREPRSVTPATWTPGGENYIFLSLGYGQVNPPSFQFEVKTTVDSNSNLELSPAAGSSAQIQTARVGEYVITLLREAPGDWRVHRRYHRPDFGSTLQVGLVCYTDWPKCSTFDPFHHNSVTIEPGMDGDPSPGTPFEPDALARFDYVRFQRVELPTHLEGLDLTNPGTVPDSELLAFLGGNALPEENEDCTPAHTEGPMIDSDPTTSGVGIDGLRVGPNPVAGTAEIFLSLSHAGDVVAELHDVNGRTVMTDSFGYLGAGSHRLQLQTENVDLPSATYFLSLSVKGESGRTEGWARTKIAVLRSVH